MTCGIYKISVEGYPGMYIGKSINIEKRWGHHFSYLSKGTHHNKQLQLHYNENPFGLRTEIIEICKEDELVERENFHITLNHSIANGYNSNSSIRFPVVESREYLEYVQAVNGLLDLAKSRDFNFRLFLSCRSIKSLVQSVGSKKNTKKTLGKWKTFIDLLYKELSEADIEPGEDYLLNFHKLEKGVGLRKLTLVDSYKNLRKTLIQWTSETIGNSKVISSLRKELKNG